MDIPEACYEGIPDDMLNEFPEIDHVLESLEPERVTISILKGIGGHSPHLEPYDQVCISPLLFVPIYLLTRRRMWVRVGNCMYTRCF